ncbi:MAG TPA: GAF domain-containing protein [Patescibacteria group bacterium]
MTDLLRIKTIRKFFEFPDFRLFADSFSHGLMVMNEEGRISFINKKAQDICFSKETSQTPFELYSELIDPENTAMLDLIQDVLEFKRNIYRQVIHKQNTYLAEAKVVTNGTKIIGSTILLSDITATAMKERQHELLYKISTALSQVSNVEQVLDTAIAQITGSVDIGAANIMILDKKTHKLRIVMDSNAPDRTIVPREIEMGEGIAGKCAQEKRPYSVYDVAKSELYSQKRKNDRGALLAIPIISKGEVFGVLNITDPKPRYFTEGEVQFLTIIANEIAVAIENSRLYERLNRRINQLSQMFYISSFGEVKAVDTRLQKMAQNITDLLDAEGCGIYVYSATNQRLNLKYYSDHGTRLPSHIFINDEPLIKNAMESQTSVILNDKQNFPAESTLNRRDIQSVLIVPIFIRQQAIGILKVFNKNEGPFDSDDENLAMITAHRIGTKIENAQLMRRLESEKELLDKIIENTSEGVIVIDRKKKILIWNRYIEELTGLKKQEVVGQPCHKVLFSRLGLKKLTQDIYTGNEIHHKLNEVHTYEQEIKNTRGEKIWISAVYSFILDEHRNVENTILVMRNTSKDKELLQAKDEFVSITTHELRTPLTAVKGYLSMILKGDAGEVTPKQNEYFGKAYAATDRLSKLVEELLYVSRIDEERMTYTFTTFPIHDLIQECVEEMSQAAKAKQIRITYSSQAAFIVRADYVKTKQVIENLIDNAIKYTRNRGQITITLEKRTREITLSVKDTGVGIPAKHLASVFDRFVRIPNPLSIKAGGAGLGLYIVKNLVEDQGGKIWVASQPGKETIFSFTIPLAQATPSGEKLERKENHEQR